MSSSITSTGKIAQGWTAHDLFHSVYKSLHILFTDILPANFTCIIPNAFSWAYRTLWTGSIRSLKLTTTADKVANFYSHGDLLPRSDGKVSAILLLHGEHSHPLTMLHLADIAQAEGRAVFSVYLPYSDEHPEDHSSLLRQSINKIDQMVTEKGGTLSNLLLGGHSRGGIEGANETYVANNAKINGMISIAGRFKVIKPSERPCRTTLEPWVNAIWDKLRPSQPLRVPFYQIGAKKDWCIDPEASVVRRDHPHLDVDASHLGIINHPATLSQFKKWVAV